MTSHRPMVRLQTPGGFLVRCSQLVLAGFGFKPPDSEFNAKESIFPVDVAREETPAVQER